MFTPDELVKMRDAAAAKAETLYLEVLWVVETDGQAAFKTSKTWHFFMGMAAALDAMISGEPMTIGMKEIMTAAGIEE